jgi:hypothetical protein
MRMKDDRSIRGAVGGVNISGDIGRIGTVAGRDVHIHHSPRDYILNAKRTRIIDLGLRRQHLLGLGGVVAVVGFAGSLASIYSLFYGTLPTYVVELVASPITAMALTCGTAIALVGFYFSRNVELRLPLLGSIEADGTGRLYLTDATAPCPLCTGTMRLYPGTKDRPSPVFVCNRSSNLHRIPFDVATMPDVADEFRSRKQSSS